MIFGMFKIPQHRKFNYIPIFYDEQKEQLDERIKKIKQELGASNEEYVCGIKGKMRSRFQRERKSASRSVRVWIIAATLGLIAYYLIYT